MKKGFLISLSLIISGCCGTRIVNCPDGTPVSFSKSEQCVLKAYNEYVKDFSINLKATMNVVDQVTVGFDNLEISNKSQMLKEKLDQRSIRLQEILKASSLAMVRNPCLLSERHSKVIESIAKFNHDLDMIRAEFEVGNKDSKVKATLDDYLYQRGRREGAAMKELTSLLDAYYNNNTKYPTNIEDLNAVKLLGILGENNLEYKLINDQEITLRFAGEDYVLGSVDDKMYKGVNGKTVFLK